jgi:hypothetical protein
MKTGYHNQKLCVLQEDGKPFMYLETLNDYRLAFFADGDTPDVGESLIEMELRLHG